MADVKPVAIVTESDFQAQIKKLTEETDMKIKGLHQEIERVREESIVRQAIAMIACLDDTISILQDILKFTKDEIMSLNKREVRIPSIVYIIVEISMAAITALWITSHMPLFIQTIGMIISIVVAFIGLNLIQRYFTHRHDVQRHILMTSMGSIEYELHNIRAHRNLLLMAIYNASNCKIDLSTNELAYVNTSNIIRDIISALNSISKDAYDNIAKSLKGKYRHE